MICEVNFVWKIGVRTVKAVSPCTVFFGEVAALDHEVFHDAVEGGVGVFSGFCEFNKVFCKSGNAVGKEANFDCAHVGVDGGYLVACFWCVRLDFCCERGCGSGFGRGSFWSHFVG